MESRNKTEQNGIAIANIVLKEILEEQQRTNTIIAEQAAKIEHLTATVTSYHERLKDSKVEGLASNPKAIQDIIKKGIAEMEFIAINQSKPVIRKFQILLFPEQDAKLFYKIVFGRWLVLLTVMLLITDVYKWSIKWSENQKEIKLQQLETDRIKKAWNYLYFQNGKPIRRLMDSAYKNGLYKADEHK